jgi:hypothetical protein
MTNTVADACMASTDMMLFTGDGSLSECANQLTRGASFRGETRHRAGNVISDDD